MVSAQELEILRTEIPALVRNYKHPTPTSWGWSCDICGDSRKDVRKARFGCNMVSNDLLCHCFNCGWAGSFKTYLQYQHPDLAQRVTRAQHVEAAHIREESISDQIISKADSETLVHLFYINKEPILKNWLQLMINKKIQIQKPENQQKLVSIHRKYHNV